MLQKDNPARRLYDLLDIARKEEDNLLTREVWAKVLGTTNLHEIYFLQRLVYLHELVEQVKLAFQQIKGTKLVNTYLKYYSNIELATSANNLEAPWSVYKTFLDTESMLNLKHIAEKLSMSDYKIYNKISDDILSDLEKEIIELTEKVHNSLLNNDLRIIILEQLEAIRRSLAEYRIRGVEGMHNVLAYTYGQFIINHKLFEKEKNKEEVVSFGKICFKYANIINGVYRLGELGYEAGKFFAKLLGYDVSNK